jgi:hypothetical protein
MKKIIIDKEEDIADVIDRILAFPDNGIIIVLPRGSAVGRSVRNFHLLRREMESAGRQLEIESVDEQILAFAKDAGVPGRHPLLSKASGNLSDIIAVSEKNVSPMTILDASKDGGKKKVTKEKNQPKIEEPVPVKIAVPEERNVASVTELTEKDVEDDMDEEVSKEPSKGFLGRGPFFQSEDTAAEEDDNEENEDEGRPRKRTPWKGIGIVLGVLVLAGAVFFGLTRFSGRAQVTLTFVKTPWQYQAGFVADKAVAQPNLASHTVPAQVFFETKNVTQLFQASGNDNVKASARGTITIYNAYSSAPQELVATTRFETPDGKIFRLVNRVTVPGAQTSAGKITPTSIDAVVVADQPGPDYNVGAVTKLTIPGFQKSPKFSGFYGAMPNGATGGSVGMKAVPTAQDITNAKASTTAILQSAIQNATGLDVPQQFKILDGASNVQVAKLTVNTSTDSNGKFSVFGQVTFQAIGFEESVLNNALLSVAQESAASSSFSALNLSYANVKADFTNGRVNFSVSANGSLAPAFASDTFKTSIAGLSIANARAAVAALPNLQDGTISVWPVWLWTIPVEPNKISVIVD